MKYRNFNDLIVNPPGPVTTWLSDFVWQIDTLQKEIYLTFDDGPVPELTQKVLDILDIYNAKATFFCVGHNVKKYPHVYRNILRKGHAVGNHTYHHLNGHKTDTHTYVRNVEKASQYIRSDLFRPPYGRITNKQRAILKYRYKIVLWNVLSQDYDVRIAPEACFTNVKRFTKPGSVIVFHDNYKAEKNMLPALTATMRYYQKNGFTFKRIDRSLPGF